MKKFFNIKIIFVLILVVISNFFYGCNTVIVDKVSVNNLDSKTLNYNEVKDSLIRFHVIANSDSDEDQQLKLKVKNKVIDYLYPYLKCSDSLDNSRKIINDNIDNIKALAESVINEEGYSYNVNVQLSRENFPDKSYGNIVLPQGNYEAFRIIIGSGEGRNWWCVMFPPLCFVDESKAEVEYDKFEEEIEKQKKNKTQNIKNSNDIKIKFKLVEIIQNLVK